MVAFSVQYIYLLKSLERTVNFYHQAHNFSALFQPHRHSYMTLTTEVGKTLQSLTIQDDLVEKIINVNAKCYNKRNIPNDRGQGKSGSSSADVCYIPEFGTLILIFLLIYDYDFILYHMITYLCSRTQFYSEPRTSILPIGYCFT